MAAPAPKAPTPAPKQSSQPAPKGPEKGPEKGAEEGQQDTEEKEEGEEDTPDEPSKSDEAAEKPNTGDELLDNLWKMFHEMRAFWKSFNKSGSGQAAPGLGNTAGNTGDPTKTTGALPSQQENRSAQARQKQELSAEQQATNRSGPRSPK